MLLSNYEDSLKEIEKSEHYIRILIWLKENLIKELYEKSLKDLDDLWKERKKKLQKLCENDFKQTKNLLNRDFYYNKTNFFIHLLCDIYPCNFENLLNLIKDEEIFIINFTIFYVLNDLVYVNYPNKIQLEDLRKSFTNVIFNEFFYN